MGLKPQIILSSNSKSNNNKIYTAVINFAIFLSQEIAKHYQQLTSDE